MSGKFERQLLCSRLPLRPLLVYKALLAAGHLRLFVNAIEVTKEVYLLEDEGRKDLEGSVLKVDWKKRMQAEQQKRLPFKKRLTCRRISYEGELKEEQEEIICSGQITECKKGKTTSNMIANSKCSSDEKIAVAVASTTTKAKETITVRAVTGLKRKMAFEDITQIASNKNIVVKKLKSSEKSLPSSSSAIRTYIFV